MLTSVTELKKRLTRFLSEPQSDRDFPTWLVMELREVHRANDPELEPLMYAVHRAFSDAADGVYSADELRRLLTDYTTSPEPVEAKKVELVETTLPSSQSKSISIYIVEADPLDKAHASTHVPFWFSGNEVPPMFYGGGTSTSDAFPRCEKVA